MSRSFARCGARLPTNRRVPVLGVDDPQGHVIYDVVPEFLREGLRSALDEVRCAAGQSRTARGGGTGTSMP